MKKLALVFFSFAFLNCSQPWYRSIPGSNQLHPGKFVGIWSKKTNPRSAINSSWHKNNWTEKIVLHNDWNFVKTYESEDFIGESLRYKKVIGRGIYKTYKDWILLQTKSIELIEKQDGELKKKSIKPYESDLLYYYYLDGNLIIPMIYDMAYNEKDFGVKDGVSKPFDDKNLNFFRYIKIYAFKEFQSHAYYPEN